MRAHRLALAVTLLTLPVAGHAQYPNVRVSATWSADPEEVTIAVNPVDPENLVAGANIFRSYTSFDRGLSWAQGGITSTLGVWGDPCVHFDAFGTAYYAHLSYGSGPDGWLDRIVVQRSLDGGLNWDDGVGVGYNPPKDEDKEWLASDQTGGPFHGNVYLAWTEFDAYESTNPADSSRIRFARSTDHGATWSTAITVSDLGGNCLDADDTVEGAVPAVGPEGQVYLSWAGHEQIYFDRSLDGGQTFGTDREVATQPGGWDFAVSGIYRANGFPVTACDTSDSPYRGRVYIAWSDQRAGSNDTNVYLISSDDQGDSWTAPVRVNDDATSRHQFFHWLTVDPATGSLYLVFYDRRNTVGDATEVYLAQSTDGGASFVNTLVSETPFTPWSQIFFGDYIDIVALDGHVHPIWMRMDAGDLSVWTATVSVATDSGAPGYAFQLAQNYPNPFNPTTHIRFTLDEPAEVELTVFDVTGRRVDTLAHGMLLGGTRELRWDGTDERGTPVAGGVYLYRLTVAGRSETRKMLLLR
ncbi:MAG: FlgD immunoglobulin-like domain containing protein [Candidatus Krumholzibacteriia bacterium]